MTHEFNLTSVKVKEEVKPQPPQQESFWMEIQERQYPQLPLLDLDISIQERRDLDNESGSGVTSSH